LLLILSLCISAEPVESITNNANFRIYHFEPQHGKEQELFFQAHNQIPVQPSW